MYPCSAYINADARIAVVCFKTKSTSIGTFNAAGKPAQDSNTLTKVPTGIAKL